MVVLPCWRAWGAVLYGGAVLVRALALYVATRGEFGRIPVLAALPMLGLTTYLLGQSLGGFTSDLQVWATWLARTWSGAALGPTLWLVLTLALAAEDGPEPLRSRLERLFWPVAGLLLAIADVVSQAALTMRRRNSTVEARP
jgi:hypothetical protein